MQCTLYNKFVIDTVRYIDMYIGVSCVEIKSEADNDDTMECSHHDKQSTGMIAVSNDVFPALRISCAVIIGVWLMSQILVRRIEKHSA